MRVPAFPRLRALVAVPIGMALTVTVLLSGCGAGRQDRPATQTAAKVNKEELTVHQINALLMQQRSLHPEQSDGAARRALERLIDQELALQKAAELKLDRDPRVVQAIEAARREIIARAYADKLGEGAARPAPSEVKKYYDDNPALFRERRVYQLHEFVVQATAEQVPALRSTVGTAKSAADVAQALKAASLQFTSNQAVRAAEQVPLDVLGELAKLKDGQLLVNPVANGARVLFVSASRTQPIDEARAAPAIEQFLHNERKRKLVAQDLKALRSAAKIEYLGKYAEASPMADGASGSAASVAEAAASAAASLELRPAVEGMAVKPHAIAASAVEAADARIKAVGGVDSAAVSKGLGLK